MNRAHEDPQGSQLGRVVPRTVTGWVRIIAVASLAAEILLVATGAAVRLTDSGLGCPTWPRCTAETLQPTAAMGVHGLIEFGNRLLTGVLTVVALLAFLAVVRQWRSRRDLFVLALAQLISIPLQAVIGGITVLTKLNPWMVGAHFVFSLLLVALMTVFVERSRSEPGRRERAAPLWYVIVAHITTLLLAVTLVLGILTTGSGPHAGDAHSIRNGLDPVVLQDFHSLPAYGLGIATLVLLVGAIVHRRMVAPVSALLAVEIAQIVVGVVQAHNGLPPQLVILHELLAALVTAAMVWTVRSLKAPAARAGVPSEPRSTVAVGA